MWGARTPGAQNPRRHEVIGEELLAMPLRELAERAYRTTAAQLRQVTHGGPRHHVASSGQLAVAVIVIPPRGFWVIVTVVLRGLHAS